MESRNPFLNRFSDRYFSRSGEKMSVQGTVNKTIFLTLILIASALFFGQMPGFFFFGLIGGLICAFAGIYKPHRCNILAPAYALFEGMVLGTVSFLVAKEHQGMVSQALMLTMITLFVFLLAYKLFGRPSMSFKLAVIGATFGVFIFYLMSIIMSLFGMPLLAASGPVALGISLLTTGVAAFNLYLDFDLIEEHINRGAPAYLEWFCSMSLLITLVWIYLEILRLLQILDMKKD